MENVTKECRKCGRVKPSVEFRRNARCRDGLSSWCAECHNAATRVYRARLRAEKAEERRRFWAEAVEANRARTAWLRERDERRRTELLRKP